MGSQYREYCCCCIPQRFVVFVLSGIYLLASIAVAGFSWFVLSQTTDNIGKISLEDLHNKNFNDIALTSTQRTILYVVAGVYTASVIISLLGLIGAIGRKRRLVQIFFYMLLLQLLVSMASGGYFLYEIFKANSCSDLEKLNTDGSNVVIECSGSLKTLRIVSCVWFGITWFFQIWMLHSVNEYVTQLRNETAYESVPVGQAGVPMLRPHSGDAFHYNDTPYDPYGNKQPNASQYAFSTPYTANVHHNNA